jgi:adenylate cyclase class IV
MFITSVSAMKKEIEIKFTLEQASRTAFEMWLETHATFDGIEHHEEVYLNNPKNSFFFNHKDGFNDAHITMRLRSKIIGQAHKDLFCSKVCHVDDQNRTVSRDEFEIDLSSPDSSKILATWLQEKGYRNFENNLGQALQLTKKNLTFFFESIGFIEQFEFTKERKIYRFEDFEIALDTLPGIGSFIEVELKSDEQDVVIGTEQIHQFLKKTGITQFVQYDRSYLHMKINPGYNFGREMNLQK